MTMKVAPFESILSSAISVLSPDVKLVGALTRQAAEIRQKAFAERDAAKKRLSVHKVTCLTCNPKMRVIHPAQ